MRNFQPGRHRSQAVRGLPLFVCTAALLCGLLASLVPPVDPAQDVSLSAATQDAPQVVDPLPLPGELIPAGTVVVAARVPDAGGQIVRFTVDGEPARGARVDPDGELTDQVGVEVNLSPGLHRLGVVVGDFGEIRSWEVAVAGLDIQQAAEPTDRLVARLDPSTTRADTDSDPTLAAGPIIILSDEDLESAVVLPWLLHTTGGTLLLVDGDVGSGEGGLSEEGQQVLSQADRPVILVQGPAGLPPSVATTVRDLDLSAEEFDVRDIHASSMQALAVSVAFDQAAPTLIVGPTDPFDRALAAALSAAVLDADLLLVDQPGATTEAVSLDQAVAGVVGGYDSVLLADTLPTPSQTAVLSAMGEGALASQDALLPLAAREAIVIGDTVDRGRAVLAATAADPDRPVLVGSDLSGRWVAANRPERVTVVTPEAPAPASSPSGSPTSPSGSPTSPSGSPTSPSGSPTSANAPSDNSAVSTENATPFLPALALQPAVDVDAVAELPLPLVIPGQGRPVVPDTDGLEQTLRRAWLDGPDAPRQEALLDGTGTDSTGTDSTGDLQVIVTTDADIVDASLHVSTLGYEWPGTVTLDGPRVTWTADARPPLPLPLEPQDPDTPLPIDITSAVTTRLNTQTGTQTGAQTVTSHRQFTAIVGLDPSDTVSPEGWIVAGGGDPRVGSDGRLYTYSVEVEPETGLSIAAVEEEISRILTDERSWTAAGAVSFQRVGSAQAARLRVVVARPGTVDAFCGQVGLSTGGRVSCWDGYRAMLNLDRWNTGVVPFHADIPVYRQYLVNHEVGHGLGHGHQFCPRFGALAPVMVQQTGGLQGCRVNGWPFP